jgi:hypothetical protein
MSPDVEAEGPGAIQARVGQPGQPRERSSAAPVARAQHFRSTLNGAAGRPAGADEIGDIDGAASPYRLSGHTRLDPGHSDVPRAAPRTLEGLLLAQKSDGNEAWIRFTEGALAGTELQLRAEAGHVITVELLISRVESRRTLATVMEEMRSRLRVRGVALSVVASRPGRNGNPETAGAATSRDLPELQRR